MRINVTISEAKIFNVKSFGNGCRFAIKINSKKQDGTYTRGAWLNCKARTELQEKEIYTLEGFLIDNEYNEKNTLEFFVMTAIYQDSKTETKKVEVTTKVEIDDDEIPF